MDITQLRREIDSVDQQLIPLFTRRMEISEQIADYKKEHGLSIFDPIREREKLKDVANQVHPALVSSTKVLYSLLFELSRSYQNAKNIAQTPLFNQIATAIEKTGKLLPPQSTVACVGTENPDILHLLGRCFKAPTPLFFDSDHAALVAIDQGLCDYALLPAERATIYEKLISCGFFIIRSLQIRQKRYLLIGKELEIYPGADKTTLVLTLPNEPGSLYRVLARFYTLGLNVAKLESQPGEQDPLHIRFYIDLETSIYAREFVRLMCELDDLCQQFHYLGSYTEVV